MNEPWLLRVEAVAARLSLSRAKTYELVASGAISSIKVGRSRRVPAAAVAAWIAEQVATATAETGTEGASPGSGTTSPTSDR